MWDAHMQTKSIYKHLQTWVCALWATHIDFKCEFCKFKEPQKQTGISKQQEAALEKQWEDRLWKASKKTTQVIIL